ncbi:hypothetical protein CAEBREN_30924 [Caenorhabditis brenneri]|uniref:Receptor L-domain domain-containing protein n=1 Tax=Caenorhabditis brenneri TaxID=135651 RepID=G0MUF1_CAEBE|nr:hypothetical protein CAEBREN_30924 [Caenorhabditis brenneri]
MLLLPILFSTVNGYAQLAASYWSFYDKKNCYDNEIMISGNSKLVELGLTNLTSISCPGLTVTRSPKLKMLNIPKLKNFILPQPDSEPIQLFLATESSKFCLTTQEVSNWIQSNNTYIAEANGKLCEPIFTEKLCKQPKSDCLEIFGDVKINGNFDQDSMKSVDIIYGSLIINGTNLTDFGFLERLEYVVQLKEKPAISVTENSQLVNYTFPKMKRIHSAISRYMVFQNNKKLTETFRNGTICSEIRKSLGLGLYALLLDGGSCVFDIDSEPDFSFYIYSNDYLLHLGLSSLSSITCPRIVISVCPNLKSLGWSSLKNIALPTFSVGPITLDISTDSPSFCLTTQEITTFLKTSDIDLDYVYGKVCKPERFDEKLCEKPEKGCLEIVGDVKIGEDSDPEIMRTVEIIYGGLTIMDSNVTSLEFLESLEHVAQLKEKPSILIANNPNLINFTFPKLKKVLWMSARGIIFMNNSNSVFSENSDYCYNLRKSSGLSYIAPMINGLTCDCEGDQITSENLPSYQSCTKLNYGLKLVNISDTAQLSFLSNEVDNIQYQADVTANFENLHPDFCLSIEEFIEMAGYAFSFIKLHAKLCKDHGDLGEYVLCSFKSMKELPNNCNILLGDLIIENGDEALMRKLMNVEYLFGSVIIRNTELKTFENLGYELCIIHLDDSKPLIQILGNKVLRDANIPYLSYVATQETRVSIIQDNNPARSANCELTNKYWKIKLNFTGGDCDDNGMFHIDENAQLIELGLLNMTSISCPEFNIWYNDKLEKLNTPNWRVIETPNNTTRGPDLSIAGNSLKFCLTTREMRMFMHTNENYYFGAIFCEPVFDEKLCNAPKIGCLEVFGDVEITPNTNLEAFKSVEIIYGSLNVSGTNLTDFGFLESLEYMAQLYEDLKFCTGFSENMKKTMVFGDSAMTINGETCSRNCQFV